MASVECDNITAIRFPMESQNVLQCPGFGSGHSSEIKLRSLPWLEQDNNCYSSKLSSRTLPPQACEKCQEQATLAFPENGESKDARRHAFVQVTERVNGRERLLFFKYMPQSFTTFLCQNANASADSGAQWQPDEAAHGSLADEAQATIRGKFESFTCAQPSCSKRLCYAKQHCK